MKRVLLTISDRKRREQVTYLLKNVFGSSIIVNTNLTKGGRYDIHVTDKEEGIENADRKIKIGKKLDTEELVEEVRVLSSMPRNAGKLTVGVDPGSRIGVAALCSNTLLAWKTFKEANALVSWIEKISGITKLKNVEVKVGRGWRSREIIEKILERGVWRVRLIDERNTTGKIPKLNLKQKLDKEGLSAVKIALRA